MLVSNSEYLVLKLVTGDEVMGQVVTREGTTVTLKNPLVLLLDSYPEIVTDRNGVPVLGEGNVPQTTPVTRVVFAPFLLSSEGNEVRFSNPHIVATSKPKSDAVQQYISAVKDR